MMRENGKAAVGESVYIFSEEREKARARRQREKNLLFVDSIETKESKHS